VQLLIDQEITLDVCLSSNLVLMYDREEDHPLPALDAAGVRVTVNTDDPAYMGTDLLRECLRCAELVGWDLGDLAAMTLRAIDAAFCPPDTAAALRAEVADYLEALASGEPLETT